MIAVPLFLMAMWVRTPALPRTAGSAPEPLDRSAAAAGATKALTRAISDLVQRLDERATGALEAPSDPQSAFAFLSNRSPQRDGEWVVLFDRNNPIAWAGRARTESGTLAQGISVTFNPFYITLNVARARGVRRAVASAVIHATPPADRLTESLETRVATLEGTSSYAFAAGGDPAGGSVVLSSEGTPLLRAIPQLSTIEETRFRRAAGLRAQGAVVLMAGLLAFLVFAWRDRRGLVERLGAIAIALLIAAMVPWNSFSNTSRMFDPAYYFSRLAGPLTANAGALIIGCTLILLAVYAVIRASPQRRWPRWAGGIGAIVSLGIGLPLASNIVRGIGQPPWGSTPGLWVSWQVPLFLFLFAVLLATTMTARMALGRDSTISFRAGLVLGVIASTIALAALWSTTSRERMSLAESDVAALGHVDDYAVVLTRRFASALAQSKQPDNRIELLQAFAASDLAAAEYPVTLGAWDASGVQRASFALTPTQPDSAVVASAVREAIVAGQPITRSVLGSTGVQILSVIPQPSGGATSLLVLPRTRLVSATTYAGLIGMSPPAGGDPPYTIAITDVSSSIGADTSRVYWRQMGDELHGDRLIATSAGTQRAHVEIDLRSRWARGERGVLVLLLDLLVAGLLWLLGALAERGFVRWLRVRAARWIYTYHARLTLALFAFFVIPAIVFAVWSYGRLRSDDRQTREALVRETLHAVIAGNELDQLGEAAKRFDTPLFLYTDGFLDGASDTVLDVLAPAGRSLPPAVELRLGAVGELSAAWEEDLGRAQVLFGYNAGVTPDEKRFVIAAPARSDDFVLDRRRRDLGMLVLFATAAGALAALWLSGIAAKRLARDLELSRIEVARAERVLAWGEMARQVAHEIKNPLTPIRLGVQHLRRARSDRRVDFDTVLNENVARILSEIDRLDEIARSFSRYGSAPADLPPPVSIDVSAVVNDVVGLEQMGDRDVKWQLRGADRSAWAMGQRDEMRDVLLNVFENARLAGARQVEITIREEERRVTIEVIDDGSGISPAVLPRIFEPHFSTRTTGSGLGLAVSRRLIEAWGGEIAVTSEDGNGARVLIALARGTP